MKKVEIKSGEFRFVGKLLTEEAPETCRVFENMLPLKSQFIHVRWSGEGIWIPYGDLRTGLDYENHTSHPAKGEMLLYPGGISEMDHHVLRQMYVCQPARTAFGESFPDHH